MAEAWALQALGARVEAFEAAHRKRDPAPFLRAAATHLARAQALPRQPLDVLLARAELALAQAHLQRHSPALPACLSALATALVIHPAEARLWFLRGRLLEVSGRSAEADRAFAEALRLNGNLRYLRTRPTAGLG